MSRLFKYDGPMTFAQALTRLTDDIMPEQANALQTHGSTRLYRLLGDAASDLAATFSFPVFTLSIPVETNNVTVTIPDFNAGNGVIYSPSRILRIDRASFEGYQLAPAPREFVSVDSSHLRDLPGMPRFYYWRSESWSRVSMLPKTPKAGTLTLMAHYHFPETVTTTTAGALHIWGGMHPAYHDLVVLTAAVRAYEAALEPENAQLPQQTLSKRRQEFALFLQQSGLDEMPIGGGSQ